MVAQKLWAISLTTALFSASLHAAEAAPINIDDTQVFQQIDGFGAAMTASSAWLLKNTLNDAHRQFVMEELFDAEKGIGISYLRVPMGSCDFRLKEYTYDDVPAGQDDPKLEKFSIVADEEYIIPMLRLAAQINPKLKIMASPWSAPAWMKDSGTLNGGKLKNDDAIYEAYANYFVRFIKSYAADGVQIDAVTLQNEPHHTSNDYPTMRMEPADQARLAKLIGEKFKAEKIETKIIVWDHNWDEPNYATAVLSDTSARPYIDGSAFHGYAGKVDAQSKVHDAFPDKNIYFTESAGGDWAKDFGNNVMWDTSNLIIGATRNWACTVLKWNLALDEKGGPKIPGGCGNCRGVITINQKTKVVTKNEEYYAFGHASKFVRPGARRVYSTSPNSVAFVNPDKSIAIIVMNKSDTEKSVALGWKQQRFTYALPPVSVATFTWPDQKNAPVAVTLTTGDKSKLLAPQPGTHFGQ
jgi:glucosylceramidase